MVWQIRFSQSAEKQFLKLDKPVAKRIISFLRDRVAELDGPRCVGEALRGSKLGEFWKYRVGDWRVICEIRDQEILISVLTIANRREIYR